MKTLLLIAVVSLTVAPLAYGVGKPMKTSRGKPTNKFSQHCEQVMQAEKKKAAQALQAMQQADKWKTIDQKALDLILESNSSKSLVKILEEEASWRRQNRRLTSDFWVAAKPFYQAQATYNIASACASGDYDSGADFQEQLQLIERDLDFAFGRSTNRCNDGSGADPNATATDNPCTDDYKEPGVEDNDNSTHIAGNIIERQHRIRQQLKNLADAKNDGLEINRQGLEDEVERLSREWMELSEDNRDLIHTKGILEWEKKYVEQVLAENKFAGEPVPRK